MQPNFELTIHGGNAPQRDQVNVLARAIYRLGWGDCPLVLDIELRNIEPDTGSWFTDEIMHFIDLDKNVSPAVLADSLAHEMIHVYQFYSGALTYDDNGKFLWKGIPMADVPYSEQPFEIIAWGCSAYLLEEAERLESIA